MSPEHAPGLVELSVEVAAPPEEVWRAFTDPEIMQRWMGDFRLTSNWQVGAPFAIVTRLNGREYSEVGMVLAAVPPTLLQYEHWSRLWRVPDQPGNRAVMTFRFAPEGAGTRVSLRHDLPAVEAIVPHSRFFWTVTLDQLRKLYAADGV